MRIRWDRARRISTVRLLRIAICLHRLLLVRLCRWHGLHVVLLFTGSIIPGSAGRPASYHWLAGFTMAMDAHGDEAESYAVEDPERSISMIRQSQFSRTFLPVDDAKGECDIDKISRSLPSARIRTFSKVAFVEIIVVVIVGGDVGALEIGCGCEACGQESPDDEPPKNVEAFEDEDRDPVEEALVAVDGDEVVDEGDAGEEGLQGGCVSS